MLLPIDVVVWLEECGVPISQYTLQRMEDFASITSPLDLTIMNGQLIYSLLLFLGKKVGSIHMAELLREVNLLSGDNQYTITENWNQLFRVLKEMNIYRSADTRRKIIDYHGFIYIFCVFFHPHTSFRPFY